MARTKKKSGPDTEHRITAKCHRLELFVAFDEDSKNKHKRWIIYSKRTGKEILRYFPSLTSYRLPTGQTGQVRDTGFEAVELADQLNQLAAQVH